MPQNNPQEAKKYHCIKNWLFLAQILLSLFAFLMLLVSGLSLQIKGKIAFFTGNVFLLAAIYVFILDVGSFLLGFPLNFYEGYILERKFNLSAQKFSLWLKDLFKKQVIELMVFLLSAEALYFFLRKTADSWWIYAALFWIFLSIILAKLTPLIFIPLFFKSSPVSDENLKEKIFSLAKKAGANIKNIFIIDFSKKTKKSNAMVCGLGRDRRILLADNLVNEFDAEQVCAVVAHELAHDVHKDTLRMLIVAGVFSFLSFFACDIFVRANLSRFGFREIYDIAAFPLLGLGLFITGLFIMPLQNSYSRRRERYADLFAIQLTNDPLSFISMMKKLGEKNLADQRPNRIIEFLLYSHPPIQKRIQLAERFYRGEEKRRYVRLDTVLPVEFQISRITSAGAEVVLPWQQGFSQDISYGGICLKANFLEQDLGGLGADKIKVFLKIHLPTKKAAVAAQAQLAWVKRVMDLAGSYILGLSFENIAQADRNLLVRYAYWRKFIPRLIFVLFAVLSFVLLLSYARNLRLEAANQKMIDTVTEFSQQLSAARKEAQRIAGEKSFLNKELAAAQEKINALSEEISQRGSALRQEAAKYKQEITEEVIAHQKELAGLKEELDALSKEKINLGQKLSDIAKVEIEAESVVAKAEAKKAAFDKETMEKMYEWVKARQSVKTGLIASFEGDDAIEDWAFTYDQSLVALAFTFFGDDARAKKIFDFYKNAPLVQGAFVNAYYASAGDPAEYIIHSGPNIWMGIAILQYTHKIKNRRYLLLAEQIAKWLIKLQAQDKEGGIRGGPAMSWYATEHNLDAYAFFNMLYKITAKAEYQEARDKVLIWLRQHSYHKEDVPIWRGRGDSVVATDTYFWSIAALGPELLAAIEMDPEKIIGFAEDNCYVETDFIKPNYGTLKISGFDFAKKRHLPRRGVVSIEFSAQVAVSYKIMSDYYKKQGDFKKAAIYQAKADDLLNELGKMLILYVSKAGQSYPCLPYASVENADTGHGWYTPQGKQTGSLSGTIYTMFGHYGFNPLAISDEEKAP